MTTKAKMHIICSFCTMLGCMLSAYYCNSIIMGKLIISTFIISTLLLFKNFQNLSINE